jgi:hypothetical protein
VTAGAFDFLGAIDKPGDAGLVHVSTGAAFRIRPIPRALVRRVIESVPQPSVPVVTLSDGREEENPLDPVFAQQQAWADAEKYRRLSRMFKTRGLELVECGGLPRPDDDSWVEDLARAGVAVDVSSPDARMSEWLDLMALATDEDTRNLFTAAQSAIGLFEWEVIAALRFFPDLA